MDRSALTFLADPETHGKLFPRGRRLYSSEGRSYKIIRGVPIMLSENTPALWHREIIEAILWEYPEEIEKMYKEISSVTDYSTVYIRYIERLLTDKQGIRKALEDYAERDRAVWLTKRDRVITREQRRDFRRYAKKEKGEKRTKTKINATGAFSVYPHFARAVNATSPQKIVELGTGAGGATASVALGMDRDATLYTVDIDFACLGNGIGIGKYQGKNIVPVCGSFWSLPFADASADAVCSYNGFDESRENDRTVSEAGRILKKGGRFVSVSRKNAFMRQAKLLACFGFSQDETLNLMERCRLYSDADNLHALCEKHGIQIVKTTEFDMGNGLAYVLSEGIRL